MLRCNGYVQLRDRMAQLHQRQYLLAERHRPSTEGEVLKQVSDLFQLVIYEDIADIVDQGGIQVNSDVVIGGPPCQGFSNLTGNRANDPRRAMWRFYMDVVEASQCKVFVVENVQNLLSEPEGHAIINRG